MPRFFFASSIATFGGEKLRACGVPEGPDHRPWDISCQVFFATSYSRCYTDKMSSIRYGLSSLAHAPELNPVEKPWSLLTQKGSVN